MTELVIALDSWHARYRRFCMAVRKAQKRTEWETLDDVGEGVASASRRDTDLCSYVEDIALGTFYLVFSYGSYLALVGACVVYPLTLFGWGSYISGAFTTIVTALVILLLMASVFAVVCGVFWLNDRRKNVTARIGDVFPTVVREYVRARKNRFCPQITFVQPQQNEVSQ